MPRKQLDILKDIFIAHKEKNENKYSEKVREFIKYLRWKGFYNKANEFEQILLSEDNNKLIDKTTLQKAAFLINQNSDLTKNKNKDEISWQVSYGADINFLQTQKLLEYMFQLNKASFLTKELMNVLGYSDKKTKGFVRQLYYLGILEEKTRKPTSLATLIYKYDAYFEDIGTLWLLHYHISSRPNLIVWNRVVNNLMINKSYFTKEDAILLFEDTKSTHSDYSFVHHLSKELNVCTRAYLESEFSKLNILKLEKNDSFTRIKPIAVPDIILLTVILLYKKNLFPNNVTLEVKTLVHPKDSPGRLLFLDELKLRESLERLRIAGYINIESFADLDQIKFNKTTDYLHCLELYYKNKFGNE